MPSTSRIDWRFAVIATLAVTCLFTLQSMGGENSHFGMLHRREMMTWGLWVLLSPAIIFAARFNQFGERSVWSWFGRHLALAALFALLSGALGAVLRVALATYLDDPHTLSTADIAANFAGDILRYSLISVAYQTFAYHRATRERAAMEARLRAELAESKLANLESGLHPHFLFNTLNSIATLVRKDPQAAETMVEQLSELLRASLKLHPLREVSLEEELTLIEQYLAIQSVRYQERLRCSIDASAAARAVNVPQLLLQPLVENAIRHGTGSRESGGAIAISAMLSGDTLTMVIQDDGVGFGNAPSSSSGTGLGLRSVESRLEHLYGAHQSFDIRKIAPTGTRVTITIANRAAVT
ncbi:MAG: histidine kinase [Gemmatimonas sp.]